MSDIADAPSISLALTEDGPIIEMSGRITTREQCSTIMYALESLQSAFPDEDGSEVFRAQQPRTEGET